MWSDKRLFKRSTEAQKRNQETCHVNPQLSLFLIPIDPLWSLLTNPPFFFLGPLHLSKALCQQILRNNRVTAKTQTNIVAKHTEKFLFLFQTFVQTRISRIYRVCLPKSTILIDKTFLHCTERFSKRSSRFLLQRFQRDLVFTFTKIKENWTAETKSLASLYHRSYL